MNILESVECRWFLDPADARLRSIGDRFAGLQSENREDRYVPTGRDDLGIKVRAGAQKPARLETKWRLEALGPAELSAGIVGGRERWRKLSIEARSAPPTRGEVVLSKSRRLRKYTSDADAVTEVAASALPSEGCNVEWTEVKREGAVVAWTLGFEAFGSTSEGLPIILASVARAFFSESSGLELGAGGSMGYAAWLELRAAG